MEAAQITGEVAMYRTAQKHQAQADKEKAIGCRPVDQSTSSRETETDRNAGRLAQRPANDQRPTETPAGWHRGQQTIRGRQKRRQAGTEASRQSETDRNAGRLAQKPAEQLEKQQSGRTENIQMFHMEQWRTSKVIHKQKNAGKCS